MMTSAILMHIMVSFPHLTFPPSFPSLLPRSLLPTSPSITLFPLFPFLSLPPSPQVTIPELHEAIQMVVKERDDLLSRVDDFHRITEAAKRERILAIDEKDKLLHR